MPIHIQGKRYKEDLPKSVVVEFVDRFRGLFCRVRFVYRRHLWNDSELPWQHFRWRYKQSNISIQLNLYSVHYGIMYIIEYEYKYVRKILYIHIYIYIYIYISQISLLLPMPSNSLRPSIYLLSPFKLAVHCRFVWDIASRIKPVISGDVLYIYLYAIWVSRSRDNPINTHTSNIG